MTICRDCHSMGIANMLVPLCQCFKKKNIKSGHVTYRNALKYKRENDIYNVRNQRISGFAKLPNCGELLWLPALQNEWRRPCSLSSNRTSQFRRNGFD